MLRHIIAYKYNLENYVYFIHCVKLKLVWPTCKNEKVIWLEKHMIKQNKILIKPCYSKYITIWFIFCYHYYLYSSARSRIKCLQRVKTKNFWVIWYRYPGLFSWQSNCLFGMVQLMWMTGNGIDLPQCQVVLYYNAKHNVHPRQTMRCL